MPSVVLQKSPSASEMMSIKDGNWSLKDCLGKCTEQILNSGNERAREDIVIYIDQKMWLLWTCKLGSDN